MKGGADMKGLICLVVAAFALGGCDSGTKHMMTVDKLMNMAKVKVLYVAIAEPYRLGTKNGKSSLCRIVRGGASYTVDISRMNASKSRVKEGDSVELELPEPSIEAFPDPIRSEELNPKTKLLVNDSGLNRIREMYDEKDRKKIIAVANKPEYVKTAKDQAEKILRAMLPGVDVTVKWRK